VVVLGGSAGHHAIFLRSLRVPHGLFQQLARHAIVDEDCFWISKLHVANGFTSSDNSICFTFDRLEFLALLFCDVGQKIIVPSFVFAAVDVYIRCKLDARIAPFVYIASNRVAVRKKPFKVFIESILYICTMHLASTVLTVRTSTEKQGF
jgi:hypothetical protein